MKAGTEQKNVFVYSVDSGVGNLIKDITHKVVSPDTYPCKLCGLTYGVFTEQKAWRKFVETLPGESVFLHRDEFHEQYPDHNNDTLPAIYVDAAGQLRQAVSAREIEATADLQALMVLVRQRVTKTR